jgi:hypothetical protein
MYISYKCKNLCDFFHSTKCVQFHFILLLMSLSFICFLINTKPMHVCQHAGFFIIFMIQNFLYFFFMKFNKICKELSAAQKQNRRLQFRKSAKRSEYERKCKVMAINQSNNFFYTYFSISQPASQPAINIC